MVTNLDELKNQIVERLQAINPLKIILFGSYAYGNPDYNSDIDICIIEESIKSKTKEKSKVRKLLQDIKIPKDILVTEKEEYDFYKNEINSVFNDIETRGHVLWQRNI